MSVSLFAYQARARSGQSTRRWRAQSSSGRCYLSNCNTRRRGARARRDAAAIAEGDGRAADKDAPPLINLRLGCARASAPRRKWPATSVARVSSCAPPPFPVGRVALAVVAHMHSRVAFGHRMRCCCCCRRRQRRRPNLFPLLAELLSAGRCPSVCPLVWRLCVWARAHTQQTLIAFAVNLPAGRLARARKQN